MNTISAKTLRRREHAQSGSEQSVVLVGCKPLLRIFVLFGIFWVLKVKFLNLNEVKREKEIKRAIGKAREAASNLDSDRGLGSAGCLNIPVARGVRVFAGGVPGAQSGVKCKF